jgi:hypothetical protein
MSSIGAVTKSSTTPDTTDAPKVIQSHIFSYVESEERKFNMKSVSTRRCLKLLANALWDNGYRSLSRNVRDGLSTCLDSKVELLLLGVLDEVKLIKSIIDEMPAIIYNNSRTLPTRGLEVVVSNRY